MYNKNYFIMQSQAKAAVCLGSTGAVGQRLLDELIGNPQFTTILTIVRKPNTENAKPSGKVVEHVVADMANLESEVAKAAKEKVTEEQCVGFSTLGVGHNTAAMTIEQHRAVDVTLNANFAKGLKGSGKVDHFVFMSAAGANPNTWDYGPGAAGFPRYNRVKGDAEEAVKQSGISHISIFRPAMISGIPHTPKIAELVIPLLSFMTPSYLLSVKVKDLAKSMAVRGAQDVSKEPSGFNIFHFPEMKELCTKAQ